MRYTRDSPSRSGSNFDLLEPTLPKLTLNRNRILDVGYGTLPERPRAIEYGSVANPLSEVEPDR